jgi:hypothetical protein
MKIFEYSITIEDSFAIQLHEHAKVLCVQIQRGTPCIWVMGDTTAPLKYRKFYIYGTGHEAGSCPGFYIGTFQLDDLVWHLFEAPYG